MQWSEEANKQQHYQHREGGQIDVNLNDTTNNMTKVCSTDEKGKYKQFVELLTHTYTSIYI